MPVLCGTALRNKGVQPLLDAVIDYLPSPLDRPTVHGTNPTTGEGEDRPVDDKAPLAALAFKVAMVDGRKTVFLRLYSGTLSVGDDVLNPRLKKVEKVSRLFAVHADRRERVEKVGAGYIIAAMGLMVFGTGDTVCTPKSPILLERIDAYEPVISSAIEAASATDKDKLEDALKKLQDEDPTFRVRVEEETGQTLISGMGELHLEIIHDRLAREYGVHTRLGRPQVVHRETVQGEGSGDGHIERVSPEDDKEVIFGGATVRVRALPRGGGIVVKQAVPAPSSDLPGPVRAKHPIAVAAALAGLQEAVSTGPEGYPLVDLEATLARRSSCAKACAPMSAGASPRRPRSGMRSRPRGSRCSSRSWTSRSRCPKSSSATCSAICRAGARRSKTSACADRSAQ